MVACFAVCRHFLHPRTILRGLEGIGAEVHIVILEIKRKRVQLQPLSLQLVCGDRCDQAAVHTTGKEGSHRHIR